MTAPGAWTRWRIALFALAWLGLAASVRAGEVTPCYSFGVVPQFEPRALAAIWLPILEEVEKRTGARLLLSGSVDIPQFQEDFAQGTFDFAYNSPLYAALAFQHQGYLPLARDHGSKLTGILVVARESPVTQLHELVGQTVVFPAGNAVAASLLVRAELLRDHGLSITPSYVKTHSSVYLEVALGRAVAGGGVVATLEQQKPEVKNALRVIHHTRGINPHPIVAHPRVPQEVRDKVRAALLALGQETRGRELLARVPIKEIGEASQDDYQDILALKLEAFQDIAPY